MRRLAAAVVLCAPMPIAAQALDEIEAWVFEPIVATGMNGFVSPRRISNSGVIAASGAFSTDGVSFTSRVFGDFGLGPVPVPIPPGQRTSFQPEADDQGRVYAVTEGDRLEDTISVFFDGVDLHLLPVPDDFIAGYTGVSPSGRVVALGTNISDPSVSRMILLWDDAIQPPRVLEQPWIDGLPIDRGIEFFPQDVTDAGDIVGIFQAVPDGEVFGAAWLRTDGSLTHVPLPAAIPAIVQLQLSAAGDLVAVGRALVSRSHSAPELMIELFVSEGESVSIIATGGFDDIPSAARTPSGLTVIAQSNEIVLQAENEARSVTASLAASSTLPLGAIQDVRDDGTIVTLYGILRPTTCLADANQDGSLDPADFDAWLNAYVSNKSIADQNLDRQLTPTDFNAWIVRFNRGCD